WASPDSDRMTSEMMGTGPYRFVEWRRGQEIMLERYDDYWGGDGASISAARLTFPVEESVRLAGVQAGEIDIARTMPAELQSEAPVVISGPLGEVAMLRLNQNGSGPSSDQRVRLGANLARERQAIIANVYLGYATPAQGQ